MPRLFRKSQRYNVAKNSWLARIVLLDNTAIEINLQPDVTGEDCLERVAQCMDIREIDYFGLQYISKDGNNRWVDRDKSLRKQLDKYHVDGARNAELKFAVQFYVTNVTKLEYEITRYLYFLQLKHSVVTGELKCSNEIACKLASYALQAEFGDYNEMTHTPAFLDDHILFPPTIEPAALADVLHDKVSKLHQKHRGMSAAAAELIYIKLAQQLSEYGHEALQTLEVNGTKIWLGSCFIGIFIKHGNGQPTVYFKWPEVLRMKVKDRNFGIETYQETIYFKLPDAQTAQYVLRMMVHQHMFFQTEYQGLDVKWSATKHSRKKSVSLHDIRSNAVDISTKKPKGGGSLTKAERRPSKFSRPLGLPTQRDSLLDPLSPTHSTYTGPEASPLPEGLNVEVTLSRGSSVGDSPQRRTPIAWNEENKGETDTPKRKKEKGLGRTPVIERIPVEEDNIDIGQPLISIPPTLTMSDNELMITSNNVTTDERTGNGLSTFPRTSHAHHQFPSSSVEVHVSEGSQESVEISQAKKRQLGGSVGQLEHTPPRSLKIRQYSPEEQWEQEATSGTRDQRGQRLERVLQSNKVHSEFEEIPKLKLDSDVSVGSHPNNTRKNRYKDILPYEYNRVKLDPTKNVNNSDYINASRVSFNVKGHTHYYIISQGPNEHSCADFWQMLWEQRTQIILMLTNEVENGKQKCHRYFPDDQDKSAHVQFEQYRVSSKFVDKSNTTITRGLTVRYIPSGEEREIMHIQYIDWPDHGIPEDPQPFITFLKTVKSLKHKFDRAIPIVVHCSAGVGRSGVLVLVDMLTETYDSGEVIDIPLSLQHLRTQRMHLVQTLGQYRFLYSVIIQYIKNARLI